MRGERVTCTAATIQVVDKASPAPAYKRVRCQKPAGHVGVHYCSLPGGGVAWPSPPVQP